VEHPGYFAYYPKGGLYRVFGTPG